MKASKEKNMVTPTIIFEGERLVFTPKQEQKIFGKFAERDISRRASEVEWSYVDAGCKVTMPAKSAIEVLEDVGVEGRWSGKRFDFREACEITGPILYREVRYRGILGRLPSTLIREMRDPLGLSIAVLTAIGLAAFCGISDPLLPTLILLLSAWTALIYWGPKLYWMRERRTSWGLHFPGPDCIAAKVGQGKA
jgi:hypothetical protein